jgi:hypothetical protein
MLLPVYGPHGNDDIHGDSCDIGLSGFSPDPAIEGDGGPEVPVGLRCLANKRTSATSTFFVDSGAGQCLSSCSAAFVFLEPCHIEVVGVAGNLSIHGIGTALFSVVLRGGEEVILRIHNCLYSFGEFNLLSVSQMQTIQHNTLELSLRAPHIRLYATENLEAELTNKKAWKRFVDIPLVLDEGLYALSVEPISSDDPRIRLDQIFDITPPGTYVPISQDSFVSGDGSKLKRKIWTTRVVPTLESAGRIFTFVGPLDFHAELRSFSDQFIAPAASPASRKQFDVTDAKDMSDLSIRFLGGGTDRILRTVSISNGLASPPSKKHARVPPLNFPQGNLKEFKTPRVSKDIVGHLHTAGIAEAVYTDTFFTGDVKYPVAQVFIDRVSRFGDVIPMCAPGICTTGVVQ